MQRSTKFLASGALAVVVVAGGTGIVLAGGVFDDDDEPDVSITGEALEQASEAALAHTGEGRVTGTEVGDEEGYYEVEVTLDNGDEVDIHLTEGFEVLGTESDAGETEDDD